MLDGIGGVVNVETVVMLEDGDDGEIDGSRGSGEEVNILLQSLEAVPGRGKAARAMAGGWDGDPALEIGFAGEDDLAGAANFDANAGGWLVCAVEDLDGDRSWLGTHPQCLHEANTGDRDAAKLTHARPLSSWDTRTLRYNYC